MVDTPRTFAELKNIFANNMTRRIHPQGIRDLIESIVNPIPGGGMELGHLDKTQAFSLYVVGQSIPLANGAFPPLSVDPASYVNPLDNLFIYDPLGMGTTSADDPEPYGERAGGQYLKGVPQDSVWISQTTIQFAPGTFSPDDPIFVSAGFPYPNYPFPVDGADDTAGGPFGYPVYAYGGNRTQTWASLGPARTIHSGMFTMPFYKDDRFALWNVAMGAVQQISGETQTITALEFDMYRIA